MIRLSFNTTLLVTCALLLKVKSAAPFAPASNKMINRVESMPIWQSHGRIEEANIDSGDDYQEYQLLHETALADDIVTKKDGDIPLLPTYLTHRLKSLYHTSLSNSLSLVHAALGVGCIALGSHHALSCWTQGFYIPISQDDIMLQSLIYTSTGVAGAFRLDGVKREATRDSMILSVAPINVVMSYVVLSDIVQEESLAIFGMSSKAAYLIMAGIVGCGMWQLSKVWSERPYQDNAFWFGSRSQNTLLAFCSMQGINLLVFGLLLAPALFGVHDGNTPSCYNDLMISYPQFTYQLSNICIDFMFASDLTVFLVTLFKYKVLPASRSVYSAVIVWNAFVIYRVLADFIAIDDGRLAHDWTGLLTSSTGIQYM